MPPKKASPYTPSPAPIPSRRGLFELVNEDSRLIEEAADELVKQGLSWEAAIEQAVAQVDQLTADKALSYAGFIRDLNAQADAIESVAERSLARVKSKRGLADRLKKRLLELLPPDFKAENEQVSLSFVGRGYKVDDSTVTSVKDLPKDILREIPARAQDWALDKDKAETALKLIQSEVENMPLDEALAIIKERSEALQGLKLVTVISVSIK